tara:strand:+ start:21142 stop:22152 length:1011 start_codon:yes stop_codon:yes gene_type:complete
MEKNELTFGVEIEFKDASAKKVQKLLQDIGIASVIEGYHNNTNFDTWKICWDGTVSRGSYSNPRNMIGGELVSPILTLNDLGQIDKICSVLKSANANIDRNCGLHIHFSWNGIKEDGAVIKSIVTRYQRFENQIDGFMPRSRRADTNHYCSTLINMNFDSDCARTLSRQSRRQQKVNLTSIYGRTGTIEFRHHSGTANAFKIRNWVSFLADFIVESKNLIGKTSARAQDGNVTVAKSANFSAIRNRLLAYNYDLQFKGKWSLVDTTTNTIIKKFETQSLRDLYDNPRTPQKSINNIRFEEWIRNLIGDEDNLFGGVDEKISYYYMGRSDNFSTEVA